MRSLQNQDHPQDQCKLPQDMPPSEVQSELKVAQDAQGHIRYALAFDPMLDCASTTSFVWLCIPGVPGSERDFRHITPYLACRAPVVRVTLPGFGLLSEEVDSPYTTQHRARYLERVIAIEGWAQIRLIGHSMGGPVALMLANRCARVIGLNLISSVGLRPHRALRSSSWLLKHLNRLMKIPLLGQWLEQLGRQHFVRAGFRAHPLHRQQLKLIIQHVKGLDFDEVRHCARTLPTHISVLCAWAEHDPLIETEIFEELAQAFSNPQIVRFIEGKHNPQKFQARPLAEVIISSLSQDCGERA